METAFNLNHFGFAKPFVKWAGGKGQLLNIFEHYYPMSLHDGNISRYIEPFVGGGAVLFDILQKYDIEEAFIFDINEDLINAYLVIKFNVDALVEHLSVMEQKYLKLNKEERKEMWERAHFKTVKLIKSNESWPMNVPYPESYYSTKY